MPRSGALAGAPFDRAQDRLRQAQDGLRSRVSEPSEGRFVAPRSRAFAHDASSANRMRKPSGQQVTFSSESTTRGWPPDQSRAFAHDARAERAASRVDRDLAETFGALP